MRFSPAARLSLALFLVALAATSSALLTIYQHDYSSVKGLGVSIRPSSRSYNYSSDPPLAFLVRIYIYSTGSDSQVTLADFELMLWIDCVAASSPGLPSLLRLRPDKGIVYPTTFSITNRTAISEILTNPVNQFYVSTRTLASATLYHEQVSRTDAVGVSWRPGGPFYYSVTNEPQNCA